MKFAIVIPTHKILQGARSEYMSTPRVLRECLQSIKDQTHKDWHIFLVGDAYPQAVEIEDVIDELKLQDRITFYNLLKPGEDKSRLTKLEIYQTGGIGAMNKGLQLAQQSDCDVIARIDHDDKWTATHLEICAHNYKLNPQAVMVFTRSVKRTTRGADTGKVKYFPDKHGPDVYARSASHSAVTWKIKELGNFRYRSAEEQKRSRGECWPADQDMWQRMKPCILDNNWTWIYAPLTTCHYRNNQGRFAFDQIQTQPLL